MRLPRDLDDARLNVTETAELLSMDPGHFRRLVRRGFFPKPKRTGKGLPYFDQELLTQIVDVVKKRVGLNGEEVMFYRRKPRDPQRRQARKRPQRDEAAPPDTYIETIMDGCRQLGVPDDLLVPKRILAILNAEFGTSTPSLGDAIATVARKLLAGQ